jgi:hypothetical protein
MIIKHRTALAVLSLLTVCHGAVLADDYYSLCSCLILSTLKNSTDGPQAEKFLRTLTLTAKDQALCNTWTGYPNLTITQYSDSLGHSTTNLSTSTGVFARDAYAICNSSRVKQVRPRPFDSFHTNYLWPADCRLLQKFLPQNFASSTVGLLLPYLALVSQLGMQTGSVLGDILSIFGSVGSPIWICSSIGHAVLFRRTIHRQVDSLRGYLVFQDTPCKAAREYLMQKLNAAEDIMKAFLQAPVRLSRRQGYVNSILILPQNQHWWITAAARINAKQKRIDAPYIGQNAIAVLIWIISIAVDLGKIPGNKQANANPSSPSWQVCMGTLFLWLVSALLMYENELG